MTGLVSWIPAVAGSFPVTLTATSAGGTTEQEFTVDTSYGEAPLIAEIDDIVANGITPEELAAVKQRTRANFIRGLGSNGGMASQLAYYQTYFDDWRELFNRVERIESVTLDDVKRVAGEIFATSNRTIAIIETEEEDS